MADAVPPGWSYNPSAWRARLPVLGLALLGCGIATYLALYQLGVVAHVWEPFFGTGSRVILKESSIAHLLPVPDALLGAVVYLLDAVADLIGGPVRWRKLPGAVLLLGVLAGSLAVGGIVLAVCQPLLFGAYCTLCLASATCSVLMAGPVTAEVLAAIQYLRRESAAGRSVWRALRKNGGGSTPGRYAVARPDGAAFPETQKGRLLLNGRTAGLWQSLRGVRAPEGFFVVGPPISKGARSWRTGRGPKS